MNKDIPLFSFDKNCCDFAFILVNLQRIQICHNMLFSNAVYSV